MVEEGHKGSMKVINGQEVWTVHMFPPDAAMPGSAAIYETEGGDFIYFNGRPVREKEVLETIPEQHKGRALTWWECSFGPNAGIQAEIPIKAEIQAQSGIKDTESRLLDAILALTEQVKAIRADVDGLKGVGPLSNPESEEDAKEEVKRRPGRPKNVLKEAGIEV